MYSLIKALQSCDSLFRDKLVRGRERERERNEQCGELEPEEEMKMYGVKV